MALCSDLWQNKDMRDSFRHIDYRPSFRRYTPQCADLLSRIREARAIVEALPILPAQEDELRKEALVGTIHYSTLIEGNTLDLVEARRAASGDLDPTSKAELELINYVEALKLVDRHAGAGTLVYTPEFILALHAELMRGIGRPDQMFKPEHEGAWRDGVALVGDGLGNVFHEGPPPEQVPGHIAGLCDYLESRREHPVGWPGPVLAMVAHYRLTDIHPFADGNGRLARSFAIAVLAREGYLPHRIFSFERHYAQDRGAYYAALRAVPENTDNYEPWLVYALGGLAEEYERVAERVRVLNRVTTAATVHTRLNRRQEQVLAALVGGERRSISRKEVEELTGAAERTANDDLSGLVKANILRRGSDRRYHLPRRAPGAGRRSTWTDERIEEQLRELVRVSGGFPTATELQRNHSALASAMARSGGVRGWRRRLGV
jgi:Fic family protein